MYKSYSDKWVSIWHLKAPNGSKFDASKKVIPNSINVMECKLYKGCTSPPNFLTPKYLGLESRPFFVDPAVFLVAQRLNTKLIPPEDSGIKHISGRQNIFQNRRKVQGKPTAHMLSPVALAYTEAFEISSLTFTLLKIDEKTILLATGHLQSWMILLN